MIIRSKSKKICDSRRHLPLLFNFCEPKKGGILSSPINQMRKTHQNRKSTGSGIINGKYLLLKKEQMFVIITVQHSPKDR